MSSLTSRATAGKPAAVQNATPPSPVDDVLVRCNAAAMPAGARLFLRAAILSLEQRPARRPGGDLRGLAAEVISLADGEDFWPAAVEAHRAYFNSISLIRVDKLLRGTLASDMPADARTVLYVLAGHANTDHQAWPCRATLAGEAGLSVRRVDGVLAALAKRGWIKKTAQGGESGNVSRPAMIAIHPERGVWWPPSSRDQFRRNPPE